MNRIIKLLSFIMFITTFIQAQYNQGALDFNYPRANFQTEVDYTGTDNNGNGYLDYDEITLKPGAPSGENFHLFEELTKGKPILIDFYTPSCAWCRTWSPIIDSLWQEHGPNGDYQIDVVGVCGYQDAYYTGYKGMYFFWESVVYSDFYPLLSKFPENAQVSDVTGGAGVFAVEPYNITAHPSYVLVCPDRTWRFIDNWTAEHNGQSYTGGEETLSDSIMAAASGCDPLATEVNDALLYSYVEPLGLMCEQNITPKIKIQNRGRSVLTSVDIVESVNNSDVTTYNWSGSLNQYDVAEVILNQIDLIPGENNVSFRVENPNGLTDENTTNDILSRIIKVSTDPAKVTVTFDFDYVSNDDFTWKIEDHQTHELIYEKSFNHSYAYTVDVQNVCLYNNKCYDFTFISNAGMGINASPTKESLTVTDENGTELIRLDENNAEGAGGGQFVLTKTFCLGSANINNIENLKVSVYPNPGNGNLNINFGNVNEQLNLKVIDILEKNILFITNINKNINHYNLNIENFKKGIYILVIFNDKYYQSIKYIKY